MKLAKFRLAFVAVIVVPLFSTSLTAQESGGDQRAYVKKQVEFSRWLTILKAKPEVRYDSFLLDSAVIKPWRIQRRQEVGGTDRGRATQYLLAKIDSVQKAEEILVVTVTRCLSRAVAAEALIDHLLGIQRPDLKLTEEKALTIGDIGVSFRGDPDAAIFFLRGNFLITVENAGKKPAADLRGLARVLDESLRKQLRGK